MNIKRGTLRSLAAVWCIVLLAACTSSSSSTAATPPADPPPFVWTISHEAAAIDAPSDIAIGPDGSVYISEYSEERGRLRILLLDSDGIARTSWSTTVGNGGALLWKPYDIAVDTHGNLYVVEYRHRRVQKFNRDGRLLAQWVAYDPVAGDASNQYRIALDRHDNVYVVDGYCNCVYVFDSDGRSPRIIRSAPWDTKTPEARFAGSLSLTVAHDDTLFVLEEDTGRVLLFDAAGRFQRTWNSQETQPSSAPATQGIAVDRVGRVYIADTFHRRIQQFDRNGQLLARWGDAGPRDAEVSFPTDVVVDGQGTIYVADHQERVQQFSASGQLLKTWNAPAP